MRMLFTEQNKKKPEFNGLNVDLREVQCNDFENQRFFVQRNLNKTGLYGRYIDRTLFGEMRPLISVIKSAMSQLGFSKQGLDEIIFDDISNKIRHESVESTFFTEWALSDSHFSLMKTGGSEG